MDNNAALLTSAVNSRFFVFMALAYVLTMAAQVGGIAHLYSRVEQITDYQTAAFAVQVLSICSISGRFFGGWLVSRIPIRLFALGNLCLQVLGLICICTRSERCICRAGSRSFRVERWQFADDAAAVAGRDIPATDLCASICPGKCHQRDRCCHGPYGMGLIFDAFEARRTLKPIL